MFPLRGRKKYLNSPKYPLFSGALDCDQKAGRRLTRFVAVYMYSRTGYVLVYLWSSQPAILKDSYLILECQLT